MVSKYDCCYGFTNHNFHLMSYYKKNNDNLFISVNTCFYRSYESIGTSDYFLCWYQPHRNTNCILSSNKRDTNIFSLVSMCNYGMMPWQILVEHVLLEMNFSSHLPSQALLCDIALRNPFLQSKSMIVYIYGILHLKYDSLMYWLMIDWC